VATFGQVLSEIQDVDLRRQREGVSDPVRRRYIQALHDLTGRNVIVYYSAFLQRPGAENYNNIIINDEDKHGFMAAFAGLDFAKGLDLVLHSPGGDVAATESIVDYLRSKFQTDIRSIVPQISMSGGTIIALAAREIVMGLHSNLGPIDPQFGHSPAIAILKEFERARADIIADPKLALLWQPILQRYEPTLLSRADHAIRWTQDIGRKLLGEGMFKDDADPAAKASAVVDFLTSHDLHRAHGRHLHRAELRDRGLVIVDLEDDDQLQEAVLSVHHACMLTMGNYNAVKLIENHNGIAHMKVIGTVAMPIQLPSPPAAPAPAPAPSPATPTRIPFMQRLKLAWQLLTMRNLPTVK